MKPSRIPLLVVLLALPLVTGAALVRRPFFGMGGGVKASANHAIRFGLGGPGSGISQSATHSVRPDVLPTEDVSVTDVPETTAKVEGAPRVLPVSPNPASGGLWLQWALPQAVDRAALEVFDVRGRRVRSLFLGPAAAGIQRSYWGGRDDAGQRVGPGIYFVRLEVPGTRSTVRLTLLD